MNDDIIFRQYEYNSHDFKKALILRYDILDLPGGAGDYGVKFIYGPHDEEENHILLGAFIDDKIVGTLNLQPVDDTTLLLRQFAVDRGMQGTGIGSKLMALAHETARKHGYTKITMHARRTAYKFYAKHGYILEHPEELDTILDPNNTKFSLHHMYIDL